MINEGVLTDHESKVIQVNYWKKMLKETDEVIGGLHGLVLLIHNSVEFLDIVKFLNKIRKDEQLKVLYISFINSYSHIKETLKKYSLHSKDIFVIDCVSGFLVDIRDTFDCIYRRPPFNLEQLKDMIMENIDDRRPNIVIVDSMSQFINFSMPTNEELNIFYQFLHSFRDNILGLKKDSIILLYDDTIGSMHKLPVISLDLIIKYEVIREKPRWRD